MKKLTPTTNAAGHLWAILWTLLCVVPFALIVLLAFKSNTDIFTNPLGIFGVQWKPSNFADAWFGPSGAPGFVSYLLNSSVVLMLSLAVAILVGAVTAYFATLLRPRMRQMVIGVALAATIMPIVMLLIPYFQAFSALSLLSNPAALAIVYGALCLPTSVLILHSFYHGFPAELREAAAIDGVGPFRTFTSVVLPLSKGPIVAVAMVSGFFIWGETQVAIVLLQEASSRTIPVGLLAFQGDFVSNTGAIFAGLTIATIPVCALYLIFNKYISKGIALGGVFR